MNERRSIYLFGQVEEHDEVIEALAGNEFDVRLFGNKSAFLVWLDHSPPDVVILEEADVGDVDEGPSFLRRVRDHVEDRPIVVLTSATDVITRGWLFEQGATDFVMKPVVTSELLARIRASLSHADIKQIIQKRIERQTRTASPGTDVEHSLSEISELSEFAAELERERLEKPKPRRALIVDDDPLTRRLLAAVFRRHGFEVQEASDGEQGLIVMGGQIFDVVVFELNLPHKSGYQILEAVGSIRKDRPKMMVLSAESRDTAVLRAFDLGADDFVAKPFNPDIIRARAQRLLARNDAVN